MTVVCGRYVSAAERARISEQFDAIAHDPQPLAPDYNVAPSKQVYVIAERHEQRQLRTMTWGLIPSWAKDPKIGNRMINARLETAARKPSFRRAWAKRRAIIPADGYYEWYTSDAVTASGKPRKQPFYIHPSDGTLLSMAGLYEIWRDPAIADEEAPGAFRWTCTILTTTATDDVGRIHDRAPLLVPADRVGEWLSPENEPPNDLLVPAAPGVLTAYPVSTAVNNVRNNDASLINAEPFEQ